MCWAGRVEKRIADKDITVYKVITHNGVVYASYYTNFTYEVGKRYDGGKLIPQGSSDYGVISRGFHSYSAENTHIRLSGDCGIKVHARIYLNNPSQFIDGYDERWYGTFLMACSIPKGTIYYENDRGEIVSESIFVKEIISLSDSYRCLKNFGYEHGIKLKWVIV